jgi:hypothetical protein
MFAKRLSFMHTGNGTLPNLTINLLNLYPCGRR